MILVVLCVVAYAPGLASIPVVDRDEARFAQASRQMFEAMALHPDEHDSELHDGGLIVPKVQGSLRLSKPPLVYWVQSASAALWTGGRPEADALWMYRLPSTIAAVLVVLMTWRLGARTFDETVGFVAAGVLAVSPLMIWEANQARADHLLLLATTSALWALWEIRVRPVGSHWHCVWLFGSIALGVLSKGPVTPMIVGLTAIAMSVVGRDWRWLLRARPLLGMGIVGVLLLLWVVPLAMRVGLRQVVDIALFETVGRSTASREGHWGPPGYHLFLLMFLLWPGCLLTLLALGRTWRLAVRLPPSEDVRLMRRLRHLPSRWRERVLGRDAELFFLAWIVPSWLVFECVATKLPHYTLPLYPAIAIISVRAVVDTARGAVDQFTAENATVGLNVWFGLGVLVCVVFPIGLSLLGSGWIGVLTGAVAGGVAGVLLWRARSLAFDGLLLKAQVLGVAAMLLAFGLTMGVILPRARVLWVNQQLAALLPEDRPIGCYEYFEDSLVYLTRGRIERTIDAKIWLRDNPSGVLTMPREHSTAELELNRLGTVGGLNYARGRFVLLDVVERRR